MMTDDDIENMYADAGYLEREPERAAPQEASQVGQIPLYPLTIIQPQRNAAGGVSEFLTEKRAGLPTWAWGLIGLGVAAGGGYLFLRNRRESVRENTADDEDKSSDDDGASSTPAPAGWSPSRSAFASKLERYFGRKGMADKVKVWIDAEEAKKQGRMKFVSPLVNVQLKSGSLKIDADLQKFCRKDGLNPIAHEDGSVGLYPTETQRGRAWEEYVDALRDEGQTV